MSEYRPAPARPARVALGVTVALIAFGSLYPFDFTSETTDVWRELTGAAGQAVSLADLLGNVSLFVPFGLFAMLAQSEHRAAGARLAVTMLGAAILALLLQFAQLWLPSRVASLLDVAWNLAGAAGGAALASVALSAARLSPAAHLWHDPLARVAGLLLALYLLGELVPLVPTLDVNQLHAALANVLLTPRWQTLDALWHGARLLAAATMLGAILPARRVLPILGPLALTVVLGHVVVVGRHADLSLTSGLLGGCLAWSILEHRPARQRRALVALLLLVTYSARAVIPFEFAVGSRDFNLVPFADLLQGSQLINLQAFLPRAFVFGALLWLAAPAVRAGATMLAAWVLLLELAQTGLADRSPSVTDAVTVILIGHLLATALARSKHADDRYASPRLHHAPVVPGRGPVTAVMPFLLATVLAVVAVALPLWALIRLPGVPYNVRELLVANGSFAASAAAAFAFLWHGACATQLGEHLAHTRRPWLVVPLGTFAAATLGLLLMHAGITGESIGDVAGSNNLYWFVTQRDIWGVWWRELFLALPDPHWIALIERPVRYAALVGPLLIALAIAHAALRPPAVQWGLAARLFAWSLPWLWLCKAIAFDWSSTDNLNELIARDGPWELGGGLYLYGLLALIAVSAAVVAHNRGWRLAATAATLLLTLPLSWWLALHGFEPRVVKYETEFSALQFLVGPDRATALGATVLTLRWMVLHMLAVGVLALGMWLGRRSLNFTWAAAAISTQNDTHRSC